MTSSISSDKLDCLCGEGEDPAISSCPHPSRPLHHSPGFSVSVISLPTLASEGADEDTYLQLDAVAMLRAQQKGKQPVSGKPRPSSVPEKHSTSSLSYEKPDDPLYVTLPLTEPPTPPPRDQVFRFSRSVQQATSLAGPQDQKSARPSQLSVIEERDESAKSPQGQMTHHRTRRTSQSMMSPRLAGHFHLHLPSMDQQRSRGDILISEVISSFKSKVSSTTQVPAGT